MLNEGSLCMSIFVVYFIYTNKFSNVELSLYNRYCIHKLDPDPY